METANVSTEEGLYRFLEEYGNNRVKRELLAFWGKHPNARFTRWAIYGLDWSKLEANRGLSALVGGGVVDTHSHNGLTFYSLTNNEEKRRPVLELATLGWHQLQAILRRMEVEGQNAGEAGKARHWSSKASSGFEERGDTLKMIMGRKQEKAEQRKQEVDDGSSR